MVSAIVEQAVAELSPEIRLTAAERFGGATVLHVAVNQAESTVMGDWRVDVKTDKGDFVLPLATPLAVRLQTRLGESPVLNPHSFQHARLAPAVQFFASKVFHVDRAEVDSFVNDQVSLLSFEIAAVLCKTTDPAGLPERWRALRGEGFDLEKAQAYSQRWHRLSGWIMEGEETFETLLCKACTGYTHWSIYKPRTNTPPNAIPATAYRDLRLGLLAQLISVDDFELICRVVAVCGCEHCHGSGLVRSNNRCDGQGRGGPARILGKVQGQGKYDEVKWFIDGRRWVPCQAYTCRGCGDYSFLPDTQSVGMIGRAKLQLLKARQERDQFLQAAYEDLYQAFPGLNKMTIKSVMKALRERLGQESSLPQLTDQGIVAKELAQLDIASTEMLKRASVLVQWAKEFNARDAQIEIEKKRLCDGNPFISQKELDSEVRELKKDLGQNGHEHHPDLEQIRTDAALPQHVCHACGNNAELGWEQKSKTFWVPREGPGTSPDRTEEKTPIALPTDNSRQRAEILAELQGQFTENDLEYWYFETLQDPGDHDAKTSFGKIAFEKYQDAEKALESVKQLVGSCDSSIRQLESKLRGTSC